MDETCAWCAFRQGRWNAPTLLKAKEGPGTLSRRLQAPESRPAKDSATNVAQVAECLAEVLERVAVVHGKRGVCGVQDFVRVRGQLGAFSVAD